MDLVAAHAKLSLDMDDILRGVECWYAICHDPDGSSLVYEGPDEIFIKTRTEEFPRSIFDILENQLNNYHVYNYRGKIYAS